MLYLIHVYNNDSLKTPIIPSTCCKGKNKLTEQINRDACNENFSNTPPMQTNIVASNVLLLQELINNINSTEDCVLWLDANDISTIKYNSQSSSSVLQWNDKSGKNNHALQQNLLLQPTYKVVNNNLVLNYSGNKWMKSSNIFIKSKYSIFVVAYPSTTRGGIVSVFDTVATTSSTTGRIVLENAQSIFYSKNPNTGNLQERFINNNFGLVLNGKPSILSSFTGLSIMEITSNNNNILSFLNGTQLTQTSGTIFNGLTNILIGGNIIPNTFWNGNICEILIYANELSNNQRINIEGYLATKWNLNNKLPTNHTYNSDLLINVNLAASNMAASNLAASNMAASNMAASNLAASNLAASNLAASNLAASNLAASNMAAYNLAASNMAAYNLAASNLAASNMAAYNLAASNLAAYAITYLPSNLKLYSFINDNRERLGCVLWLDASDQSTINLTKNSLKINQWDDKSGNNNHAIQSNVNYQPSYDLNNKPSINTRGNRFIIITNDIPITSTYSIFIVGLTPVENNSVRIPLSIYDKNIVTGGNGRLAIVYSTYKTPLTPPKIEFKLAVNGIGSVVNTYNNETTKLFIYDVISSTNNKKILPYINGTEFTPQSNVLFNGSTNIVIGGGPVFQNSSTPINFSNDNIYEILIYNTELSQLDRQNVEDYLANKWGL